MTCKICKCNHYFLSLVLNISSIRWDIANPPNMLIDAKKQAIYDKVKFIELSDVSSDIKAPKIIMPEIAFETLIKGECKAGVTPHIMK